MLHSVLMPLPRVHRTASREPKHPRTQPAIGFATAGRVVAAVCVLGGRTHCALGTSSAWPLPDGGLGASTHSNDTYVAVQYSTVQYNTVQYSAVQRNKVWSDVQSQHCITNTV